MFEQGNYQTVLDTSPPGPNPPGLNDNFLYCKNGVLASEALSNKVHVFNTSPYETLVRLRGNSYQSVMGSNPAMHPNTLLHPQTYIQTIQTGLITVLVAYKDSPMHNGH